MKNHHDVGNGNSGELLTTLFALAPLAILLSALICLGAIIYGLVTGDLFKVFEAVIEALQ